MEITSVTRERAGGRDVVVLHGKDGITKLELSLEQADQLVAYTRNI